MEGDPCQITITITGTITSAIFAVIAAVSSVKNGRTLNRKLNKANPGDGHAADDKAKKKKISKDDSKDWYKPPDVS